MLKKRLLWGGILIIASLITLFVMERNRFYVVEVEDSIDAPIEIVWYILADEFHNIHRYSDAVESVEILGDKSSGLGCVRKCKLKEGGFMQEEIVIWEPNNRIQIVIKDSSMPMVPGTNVLFELEQKEGFVIVKATGAYRLKYMGPLSPFIAKNKYKKLLTYLIQVVKDAA